MELVNMAYYLPPDEQRCTAESKQSEDRCKKWSLPFQEVCEKHGGESPQAKMKALERMAKAMDPLAKRKLEMMEDAYEKYKEAKEAGHQDGMEKWQEIFNDRFEEIADRAGPPKVKRSEMTGEDGGPVELTVEKLEQMSEEELEMLEEIQKKLK